MVDMTRLLTVCVNERTETQVSFWDLCNLVDLLVTPALVEPAARASSTSTPLHVYYSSSRLLFLVGKGSRHIWSYDIDPINATVQLNPTLMTIGDVALLQKRTCNVCDVELERLLVAEPNVLK